VAKFGVSQLRTPEAVDIKFGMDDCVGDLLIGNLPVAAAPGIILPCSSLLHYSIARNFTTTSPAMQPVGLVDYLSLKKSI